MKPYRRSVKYYETDRMGITHHSNYVRWLEEARLDFLAKIGCDYADMEANGIISPVIAVNCQFKKTTTYPDDIEIRVWIRDFTGVRFSLEYEVINLKDNSTACTADSEHCFVNEAFKPINLKKANREYYDRLLETFRLAESREQDKEEAVKRQEQN